MMDVKREGLWQEAPKRGSVVSGGWNGLCDEKYSSSLSRASTVPIRKAHCAIDEVALYLSSRTSAKSQRRCSDTTCEWLKKHCSKTSR